MFVPRGLVVYVTNVVILLVLCLRTMQSQVPLTCPDHDVPSLQADADGHTLSLLFYYVPWNNEALHMKSAYEEVAHQYGRHLHFATVDCWHIACNCSAVNRWSQPSRQWPKLVAHYSGGRITVQYTGNDWSPVALRQFIDKLMYPLMRVHTKSEVKHLNMLSDGVVLGLFGSADERAYASYVHAAIKWLEIDPLQAFRFTVGLGDAIHDILNDQEASRPRPRARLLFINANGIDVFNATKWDSNQIVLWLQHHIKRAYEDLYTYTSPTKLALGLKHGPALSIFTADEPHAKLYADMSFAHRPTHPKLCDRHGTTMMPLLQPQRVDPMRSCVRRQYLHHTNLPLYYRINEFLRSFSFHTVRGLDTTEPSRFYVANVCSRGDEYYIPERKVTVSKFLKRTVDNVRDKHNADMPPHHQQNRTMAVNILDGHRHRDLMRSLGLAVPQNASTTTVIVADPLTESVYVMPGAYSYEALMQFVLTFYRSPSSIGRHLRMPSPKNNHNNNDPNTDIVIPELSAHQLTEAIQRSVNSTFVVLFYTPECTLSNIMSHALIQVAALLRPLDDLHMVRLNVQANDLPWYFEMADTPTLLVIPRGRLHDDGVYPRSVKVSVPNVYTFIVRHLNATQQIRVLLDTCKRRGPQAGGVQKCLPYVKNLAVQHIGRYLKRWQFHEHERHSLYGHLQELKELNTAIQRSMFS